MAIKETIAFVGTYTKLFTALANRLAKKNYRILLVSDSEVLLSTLSTQILQQAPSAEIETIGCVKDGCWEADIIMMTENTSIEKRLLKKIKDVATQKIVVYLREDKNYFDLDGSRLHNLQQALPNSKVIELLYKETSGKPRISGEDMEAVAFISGLLEIENEVKQ